MKISKSQFFGVLALTAMAIRGSAGSADPLGAPRADGAAQQSIRFQINMIETQGGEAKPISSALVEGPTGLDFNITLHTGHYDMDAQFLTDMSDQSTMNVRAKLATRRLYGHSQNKLPLYEEDNRSQSLDVGFDEQMILFPFGESSGDNLRIDIVPALNQANNSAQAVPLKIAFLQKAEGVIHISASKTAHRFQVEAAMVEDGRVIARGASELLLQQKRELTLTPVAGSGSESSQTVSAVALSIDRYERGCPAGFATFSFDLYGSGIAGQTDLAPEASDWAGIGELGSDSVYNLTGTPFAAAGKVRELRLRISRAAGETGY